MFKVICFFSFVHIAFSLKILALFSHEGKSHGDVFVPLLKGLVANNHQVTVISHYPLKNPVENYHDIVIKEGTNPLLSVININELYDNRLKFYITPLQLLQKAKIACEMAFNSKNVQNFLKKNQTFDIILIELFNSDCFMGFLEKFPVPVIGLSSCTVIHWTNERFGNPTNPSYIPNNLLDHSEDMTFFQRLENFLYNVIQQFIFDIFITTNDEMLAKNYFGQLSHSWKNIINNVSLLLVNSHFTLNFPRPFVPSIIEIGGIHLGNLKKLPEKIEKWINESTHGVIYFSLGSMIKGHTFPTEKRQEFLKAFGRLPQRVLWKWENETMPGKPDNVMIHKWMPQFDILCHPNVLAFISHGGLLGTTEAVNCGVPVIVMPQYGDQYTNAKALEANGGGIILHLKDATEEKIYNALDKVLNPDFRRKAQELSARFKDRPLSPLNTAIYWVEYVARHKGAPFMRTAAVDMPLYKYLLLDVIAFLFIIFVILFISFFYICRFIVRSLFIDRKMKIKSH